MKWSWFSGQNLVILWRKLVKDWRMRGIMEIQQYSVWMSFLPTILTHSSSSRLYLPGWFLPVSFSLFYNFPPHRLILYCFHLSISPLFPSHLFPACFHSSFSFPTPMTNITGLPTSDRDYLTFWESNQSIRRVSSGSDPISVFVEQDRESYKGRKGDFSQDRDVRFLAGNDLGLSPLPSNLTRS